MSWILLLNTSPSLPVIYNVHLLWWDFSRCTDCDMVYFHTLFLYNSNIMIIHNWAVSQGETAPAVLFSSLKTCCQTSGQDLVPVSFQSYTVVPLPRRSTVTCLIDHNPVAVTVWAAVPPLKWTPPFYSCSYTPTHLASSHLPHMWGHHLQDQDSGTLRCHWRFSGTSTEMQLSVFTSLSQSGSNPTPQVNWLGIKRSPAQHSHPHRTSTTTETQEKLTTNTI